MAKAPAPIGPEGTCTYRFDSVNNKWLLQASNNPGPGCFCPDVLMGQTGTNEEDLTVPAVCGTELAKLNAISDVIARKSAAAKLLAPSFAKAGKPIDV